MKIDQEFDGNIAREIQSRHGVFGQLVQIDFLFSSFNFHLQRIQNRHHKQRQNRCETESGHEQPRHTFPQRPAHRPHVEQAFFHLAVFAGV